MEQKGNGSAPKSVQNTGEGSADIEKRTEKTQCKNISSCQRLIKEKGSEKAPASEEKTGGSHSDKEAV